MIKSSWVLFTALISYSAMGVSFQEKLKRVEFLEELSAKSVSMNMDAYRRELQYEKHNLSIDQRAENEANLLAEKIKIQVLKAYEVALSNKTSDEAVNEVRYAIEKDLALIDPSLKEEIKTISFKALEDAQTGSLGHDYELAKIEKSMLKMVKERSEYLNSDSDLGTVASMYLPSVNKSKDAERKEYFSKEEILESLVSERDSTRWVSTSNLTLRSMALKKSDAKISFQVKVEFLGIGIEAGPTITFKREYSTSVFVMSEGLSPILLKDGNFDFFKKDSTGKVIVKGGVKQRRFVNFSCEVSLEFHTDYTGEGKFSVAGMGASSSASSIFVNSVNLSSRRILVPEYIAGKTVTYKYLQGLCHNDFLKTHTTSNMTVTDSLNIMMKNIVESLRFSHPKTKCATDVQCFNWYNNEVAGLVKIDNYPRCVEEGRQKYRACELRGLEGQNCSVVDKNGKLLSDGLFEFVCDVGLKCIKVRNEGWFQNWSVYESAKGKCMPKNPKTYINPR